MAKKRKRKPGKPSPAVIRDQMVAARRNVERVIAQQMAVPAVAEYQDVIDDAFADIQRRHGRPDHALNDSAVAGIVLMVLAAIAVAMRRSKHAMTRAIPGVRAEARHNLAAFVKPVLPQAAAAVAMRDTASFVAPTGVATRLPTLVPKAASAAATIDVDAATIRMIERARASILAAAPAAIEAELPAARFVEETRKAITLESWEVERIARTEASRFYNAEMRDSLVALANTVPGLQMRWTEHVSDLTGLPTDHKTAPDSVVLHGQIPTSDGLFHMPSVPGAGAWAGDAWSCPPNRPNDRAVLTPWMQGWDVPAWQYRDGKKFHLR